MRALLLAVFLVGCKPALTPADDADLVAYAAAQAACDVSSPTAAADDACKEKVRADFAAKHGGVR